MALLKGSRLGDLFEIRNDFSEIKLFGKSDNTEPSKFILQSTDGTTRTNRWLYFDSSGLLKTHSADPQANPDGLGSLVGSGVAGANTALSNVASTAIPVSLISDANNTDDLGSNTYSWRSIYLGTSVVFKETTNNAILASIDQATAESTVNIPSMASTPQYMVLDAEAQTLTNKTLTSLIAGTSIVLDQTTADYTLTWADPTGARAISFEDPGGTDVIAYKAATQTLTGKTLTDNVAPSLLYSAGGNKISFQDAVHTVVGRDTTDTLTNKTIAVATNTVSVALTGVENSGGAAGDVAYWNGSNWTRLAKGSSNEYLEAGTTPAWTVPALASAGSIQNGATIEDAGANDAAWAHTQQGTAGATVVIPNFAGATANTLAFINFAQTWTANQTIQYGKLLVGDSDNGQTLQLLVNENMTGDKTLTYKPNDGSRTIDLKGNITFSNDVITVGDDSLTFTTGGATDVTLPTTGTLSAIAGAESLSNKTLAAPKIATGDGIFDGGGDEYLLFVENAAPVNYFQITTGATGNPAIGTKLEVAGSDANINFEIAAKGTGVLWIDNTDITFEKATFDALVVVADQTGEDHTFNIPDIATGASDTFAFLAEAQTLTNKTVNVDSNTFTNINADELDPIATGNYGIPFIYEKAITNVGGDTNIVINSAFKFRVMDAWSVNQSGDGGTWKLKSDGGDITNTVTVAANDKDIDRASQIDDAFQDIAATTGDLIITSDAGLDAIIYVLCLRMD